MSNSDGSVHHKEYILNFLMLIIEFLTYEFRHFLKLKSCPFQSIIVSHEICTTQAAGHIVRDQVMCVTMPPLHEHSGLVI